MLYCTKAEVNNELCVRVLYYILHTYYVIFVGCNLYRTFVYIRVLHKWTWCTYILYINEVVYRINFVWEFYCGGIRLEWNGVSILQSTKAVYSLEFILCKCSTGVVVELCTEVVVYNECIRVLRRR